MSLIKGNFLVLLGKNGSGKTTILKCLTRILYAEKGEVLVYGKDSFTHRLNLSKEIGILFEQKSLLFTDLKAIDYLFLLQKIYGLSSVQLEASIQMLDTFLPCRELLDKQVRVLSYGEKMKIELLSIILHQPSILILDEPFVGLDPLSQQQMLKFLQYYRMEKKATIVLTTHQFLEVLELAD